MVITNIDLTELDKLEKLLRSSGYGHVIRRDDAGFHQIFVEKPDGTRMWDAICHFGSYGHEKGLLEVMGAPVVSPDYEDSVEGWLTADEVFSRWQAWLKEQADGRL